MKMKHQLILLAIIVIVLAGFIIYSTVYTNQKAAEEKEEALQSFSKKWEKMVNDGTLAQITKEFYDGIQKIKDDSDEEYKKIMEILDKMDKAVEKGNVDEVNKIMEELKEYVETHNMK